jgi:hypothetical protein
MSRLMSLLGVKPHDFVQCCKIGRAMFALGQKRTSDVLGCRFRLDGGS